MSNNKTCGECKWFHEKGNYCRLHNSQYIFGDRDACNNFDAIRKPTVFHQITASPEVLAEKLVYSFFDDLGNEFWTSILCNHTQWESRAEALAATVAKLKEVVE